MKIRSITCFLDPGWPLQPERLDRAAAFIAAARQAYTQAGYEVQTTRLATIPFPRLLAAWDPDQALHLARSLESAARARGYEYVSLGPALPQTPESYRAIPGILKETENVFLAGVMAAPEMGISLPAVRACAEVIQRTAPIDPNGFGNLYFAALANVPPGSPFFPAAYHQGGTPAFALATEAADLAVRAFSEMGDVNAASQRLTTLIEQHAAALSRVSQPLAAQFDLNFGGIDFSLAPFPEPAMSIGAAMERMGVPAIGLHGSLAAAALITAAVDQANFPRAGFCGLFMPLLEDQVLAGRAAEGSLTVHDLLLYSAVCGTGLDTIPLPGDTTVAQMTALLLDLAALALRLDKPLTARLLPIPGKSAGDLTDFDFPYFANSRILGLRAAPLSAHLAGEVSFQVGRSRR